MSDRPAAEEAADAVEHRLGPLDIWVLEKMVVHLLTEAGLKKFDEDWRKAPGGM